jgi:hypothetical protein
MNAVKTPEIWQVCEECGGSGNKDISPLVNVTMWKRCPHCAHSPKPGYRAILYTPERWEQAGGVLHDDLRVWFKDHYLAKWVNDSYKSAMTWKNPLYFQIIVSTPAITMKDLEEI